MTPLDNMDMGDAADQPPASEFNKDKFWYSEDTGELSLSDGAAWIVLAVAGGGGSISFGDNDTFGNLVSDVTANNSFQLLEALGNPYSLSITNPLAVDAWVSGVVSMSELVIETGAYVGPLHYRQQLNGGGDPWIGAAIAMMGTVEAGLVGPLPPNGSVFLPVMVRPFGFQLAAGATSTFTPLHAMFLVDDGSVGTYPVSFNGLPRFVYSGVPVA